ncbi:intraflagellar transport-associated protein [Protopterus annectens]|uniref:intraflagellar transport-associated protein n=1 Tax=Protopterus annectens TaxID=7888 RepID=UPI001CFB1CE0|nr:intraflagellar transport-associated protein [Protopterus annectens]
MDEDELMEDVLNRFLSSHEQTYEEFLGVFTHDTESSKTSGEVTKDEERTVTTSPKVINETALSHGGILHCPALAKRHSVDETEDELVIGEGVKVGAISTGDLHMAGRVKMDNYLQSEDPVHDEDINKGIASARLHCLPGEAESQSTRYTPSFAHHTFLDFKMTTSVTNASDDMEEVSHDDVQPFTLDKDFDYDNVALSAKFSEAELYTMSDMLKHKKPCLDSDTEEFED